MGLLTGWLLRSTDGSAEVGKPAPEFEVVLIEGGSFDLSTHFETDRRPLVLNLWASWCVPCREEIPEISAFSREHPDIKVLGVAVEDVEADSIAFARDIGAEYDLALGDGAFEEAYPRIGLPATYVIGDDGVVRALHNGILDKETLEALVDS